MGFKKSVYTYIYIDLRKLFLSSSRLTVDLVIALCGAGTMIPSLFLSPATKSSNPEDLEQQRTGREEPSRREKSSLSKILIFEDIIGGQSTEGQQSTENKGPSYTFAIFGRLCYDFP
jgi:hypothetical protein